MVEVQPEHDLTFLRPETRYGLFQSMCDMRRRTYYFGWRFSHRSAQSSRVEMTGDFLQSALYAHVGRIYVVFLRSVAIYRLFVPQIENSPG